MNTKTIREFLKKNWPLILIMVIGFCMRWQNIRQPFVDVYSWRQSSTAMMAQNYFTEDWNIFYPQVNWTGPGNNYQGREFQTISYLAAITYNFLGQHDYIGRIIALCFGMWGIFALYQLVLVVWDHKHALAAALMMAILPGSAFTDRSFLPDPVMVSLSTTCMWLFVLYLKKDKLLYLWLAAAIGCWGILTKLTGMIIVIPMSYALYAAYQKQQRFTIRSIKPVLIAAIIVLAIIAGYYLWARYLSLQYPPYHFAGDGNWIWDNPKVFLKRFFFLDATIYYFKEWMLGYPAIVLFTIGLLTYPPKRNEISNLYLGWFFHFLLVGYLFFYIIGAKELVNNPWNIHLFLPATAVFCGRFLVIIYDFKDPKTWLKVIRITVIITLLIIFNQQIIKHVLFNETKAIDGYKMGKALKELKRPGDLVVTITHVIGDPVAIYYTGGKGWIFPPAELWGAIKIPGDDAVSIKTLNDLHSRGAVWLGVVQKQYKEIKQEHLALASYLHRNLEIVRSTPDYVIFKWP